ncbi:MAG: hypothetical protein DRI44_06135, partial [Chlamydiae bacterium]
GSVFWDDTDDKQIIFVEVFNPTSPDTQHQLIGVDDNGGTTHLIQNIGRTASGTNQLTVNTEYTFYIGLQDAGSVTTTAKQSFVDNLHTSVIDDPLSSSLGTEVVLTNPIVPNNYLEYTKTEDGSVFGNISTGWSFYKIDLLNFDFLLTGHGFNSQSVSGCVFIVYGNSGDTVNIHVDGIHFGKKYSHTGYLM